MNPPLLSDSVMGGIDAPSKCPHCGATIRLDHRTCINCFLHEGLETKGEGSRETFESVLLEANVTDTHWRLGHYEILEEIGRGGMGVIYRARQQHSRRIVALKRILAHQVNSHDTLVRFRREAEAVASLDHPNILPIYEVSESQKDGLPYFSMKYATGGSLRSAAVALRNKHRECVRVMAKVARAIAYAHSKGILHRDLQPGNILLDENGEPMVSDFGLAKWLDQDSDLTRTLETLGTPGYIAPEQAECRGTALTNAADIYSLGAILFYLLAGRPPFVGPNVLHVIHQAAASPAPRLRSVVPLLDRDVETIVARCLESDPKARYQSAGALADDLEHWVRHEPIRARRVSPTVRAWRWSKRNPKLAVATTAAFLLALATIVLFFWRTTPPAPAPDDKSIAVLPFENLGDKENEYLAEGIHDEVLNDLARIADLKVISRTSVMGYRPDKARNLRQIADTLRVRYVLEGSMQGSKDQIRIRTQLIDSQSDTQVWAEQYEGAPANVLSIESEIAKTIAERLQAKLSPSEKLEVERVPTTDLAAFDLYLRGRYSWNKRSVQGLERSIEYFNAAIQRDPKFVLAYVGLAESYDLLIFYADRPPDLLFPKVEDAARRALQIDESLGQAHVPLARVEAYYRWNRDAALSEFRRALELNPNDETAHHLYGEYLIRIGLTSEGMRELSAALKLSPAAIANNLDLGTAYYALRQYDQAIEQYHKTLQMDPNFAACHAFLAMAYSAKGMHAQAIAEIEKATAMIGERPINLGLLGNTLAAAGRRDDASQVLEKLILRSQQSYVAPLSMALIYAGLGQKDRALELLEKGYAEHDPWLVQFLRNYYQFDELRPDSRFAELMQRVGVAPAQSSLDAKASRSPPAGIAVLPFENLSSDPKDAFFGDGVQDEILNDLAKIAALKVISRTSVMQYQPGAKRNLRQIANELGVTHVVEGSVQRSGSRVRVSAQLIDAKTDRLVWVQDYDRALADSLTLEADLALEVATAVGATLGPQEKARVTAKPTDNSTAYDDYLAGRVFASEDQTEKALRAYEKAVKLDPNFALAWAGLSSMQSVAHWEVDSSPQRVSAAKSAMDRALALDPNLPEVHLALGYYLYYVLRDFTGALSELRQAEQALPNDTDVIKTIAMVQRRLGQWDEALTGFRRVVELDPRDIDDYSNLALTYEALRRFPEALATFDRALSWEPVKLDSESAWKSLMDSNGAWKALLLMKADALWATGNLQSSKLPYESAYTIGFMRAGQALLKHRYAESKDILSQALADKSITTYSADVFENREILVLMLGFTQQHAGDIVAARATYQQVVRDSRHTLETVSPGSSAETQARVNLAWAYAGLGEADSAIEEGRKAMAIMPSSKDAYRGPKYEENMARIYALLGDAEHAIPILDRLLHIPYLAPLTLAKLRTDPTLDQIRNHPGFQKLFSEPELKTVYK